MSDSHGQHGSRASPAAAASAMNPIINEQLRSNSPTPTKDRVESVDLYTRPTLHNLVTREFYQQEGWFDQFCEALFKIKYRGTTIKGEIYHGIIHFISCLYCLAVVPQQLSAAGYDSNNTVVAVALLCGIGSIFCGIFANLPFVLAPPTVVTIFQSVYLQQNDLGPRVGNYGVILSGAFLMLFGWRPLGEFVKHLIPVPIQVGTVVGIGLLTALAGSTEIDLVISGEYKILRMGHITPEIVITFTGVIIICVAMRYHVKGSFCLAVVFCSIVFWIYDQSFPSQIFAVPTVTTAYLGKSNQDNLPLLTIDLLFLYVLYLNGLVQSLSNLAVLTRDNKTVPRGRWIFILSGFFTICGGLLTTAPILVSPESSAAIKEGAKTGLSTVVAGVLFLFAAFLSPLFKHIPGAGTSPVLIMIGLILFQNVNRIDWRNVADAAPAFVVLFYIPFTYSVIQGVILGYIMYLSITLFTGELLTNVLCLILAYFPHLEDSMLKYPRLVPYMPGKEEDEVGENEGDEDEDGETRSRPPSTIGAPVTRSESTAGGTVTTLGTTATAVAAPSSSKPSRSGKFTISNHDQSVLEAFVDMNPSMSFSGPSEPRTLRRAKSAMVRSGGSKYGGSTAGGSEYGGAGAASVGRPSVELTASGNHTEGNARQLQAAAANAPPINIQLVSSSSTK